MPPCTPAPQECQETTPDPFSFREEGGEQEAERAQRVPARQPARHEGRRRDHRSDLHEGALRTDVTESGGENARLITRFGASGQVKSSGFCFQKYMYRGKGLKTTEDS